MTKKNNSSLKSAGCIETHSRSVATFLTSVFPNGTTARDDNECHRCPNFPSDVFAATGILLERSGAYSALRVKGIPSLGMANSERPILWLKPADRQTAVEAGKMWASDGTKIPDVIRRWWKALVTHSNEPVFVGPSQKETPGWWLCALLLFIASDEAAAGVGYSVDATEKGNWFAQLVFYDASRETGGLEYTDKYGSEKSVERKVHTLTKRVSPDVCCVLPKSRTAPVGSTLRSLSHNMALLPAQGIVRTEWYPQRTRSKQNDERPMNLLLVPFPHFVTAEDFVGEIIDKKTKKLGWFKIRQGWLPDDKDDHQKEANLNAFATYIEDIIEKAERDVGQVHGLIFPEQSLNWAYYDALRKRCATKPNIEILIAGLGEFPVSDATSNSGGRPDRKRMLHAGNFAVTTCFVPDGIKDARDYIEFSRPKHHRWKLDGQQIRRYALGAALDPSMSWWENIGLTWRELDITVLRETGTLAALICEDLARLDPSQIALRAIGPNLIVVLLMDGPQLGYRWAARNATVLAEDPGSSVLTFTSMGLINRINRSGNDSSRCIGLWRDDQGTQKELQLRPGADALLLTLTACKRKEYTLDGRDDGGTALSWILSGEQSVTAKDRRPGWIEVA